MSPVLIDQRRLLILIIAILCALVVTFYSGYFAGIRHAYAIRPHAVERAELQLPAAAPEPVRSEAVKPAVVAPGANIDVDVPDARPAAAKPKTTAHKPPAQKVVAKTKPAAEQKTVVKQKLALTKKPAVKQKTTAEQNGEATAETGTAASESEPEAKPATTEGAASQIVDDASRDDARYSIQIGIYGSQNNASKQVDSLIAQHLSGYYQTYQNQDDEARYRVRFGYFASYTSASRALELWNKTHSDSRSYIVRLLH